VNGIPVMRVPFAGCRRFFIPFAPLCLVKRFDIVHIHATDQFLDWAHLAHRRWRVPYVVTTHGLFFHTERFRHLKGLYLRLITRPALRRAGAVFAVSANDRDLLAAVGEPSYLLRNPIVPIAGPPASGTDLVFLGRLAANKRVDVLLDFLREIRRRLPKQRLHIVGNDTEGFGNALKRQAVALGLAPAVSFHGYLDREALARVCAGCGFVVSASRYEGFGLSVVEGMSLGLLPVMHDNPAFREIRDRSGVGLVIDFDNPRSAAEAFIGWRRAVTAAHREAARSFAIAQGWGPVANEIRERYRVLAVDDRRPA
jgi:alpha-1,3-mannosyltransferase